MLIDSHCHLNYPQFADLSAVIRRAEEAGVRIMQTISTKRADFAAVIAIAEAQERVYASVGIHPHEAEAHGDITAEELLALTKHPKVIGIGETGLDYYYEHSPREAQRRSFRIHIEAARRSGLPLIVHSRDADEDTAGILREEMEQGSFTGLIHCFSSGRYLADKCIDIGMYLSFSGILTFKKSEALREVAEAAPLERLLVETDAPYLAPEPHRGKPNEPAYTRHVAEKLAAIKQLPYEAVAKATTDNFFRLFSKASQSTVIS